jgi:hypothetical protein
VVARAAGGQVVPVSARDEEEHDAPLDSSTSEREIVSTFSIIDFGV